MATKSSIEWTESTWNPVTGCTKMSSGCKNCYAERMAKRLHAMGQPNYRNGFQVTCHPETLGAPLKLKKPQMIFVNSMSDLFHRDVPASFIDEIFFTMNEARWHYLLTQRLKLSVTDGRRLRNAYQHYLRRKTKMGKLFLM